MGVISGSDMYDELRWELTLTSEQFQNDLKELEKLMNGPEIDLQKVLNKIHEIQGRLSPQQNKPADDMKT